MRNNPEFTFEDYKQVESLGELTEFTRVYGNVYMALIMGFYFRRGEIPELAQNIAEVWAKGVAELYEATATGEEE